MVPLWGDHFPFFHEQLDALPRLNSLARQIFPAHDDTNRSLVQPRHARNPLNVSLLNFKTRSATTRTQPEQFAGPDVKTAATVNARVRFG